MEQPNNRWEEEAAHARAASRRMKRRILLVTAGILVLLILLAGAVMLMERLTAEKAPSAEDDTSVPLYFYPSEPDVNILEDPDYLGMDRRIYCTQGGETRVVTEDNIDGYGPAVLTLRDMLNAIVSGDHEAYNALFSTNYYATEGNAPKEAFTMQRVYDIELTVVAESKKTDDQTGKTYTQYELIVKYKIARNDGTFRRDIGSNEARKQYYVLSDSTGSQVLIDQVLNYNYQQVAD